MDASALAGGAIGSLITLGAGVVVRFSAVPREVSANDRMAAERDSDLEQWVADASLALKRRLREVRNELAAENTISGGEYGVRIGLEKEKALHAYRDQQELAKRDVARVFDREGWLHRAWRLLRRRRRYALRAPARVERALDVWRLPATQHLSLTDEPQPIEVPTKRTLEDAIRDLEADPTAFQ